jgi:hypothetical protein
LSKCLNFPQTHETKQNKTKQNKTKQNKTKKMIFKDHEEVNPKPSATKLKLSNLNERIIVEFGRRSQKLGDIFTDEIRARILKDYNGDEDALIRKDAGYYQYLIASGCCRTEEEIQIFLTPHPKAGLRKGMSEEDIEDRKAYNKLRSPMLRTVGRHFESFLHFIFHPNDPKPSSSSKKSSSSSSTKKRTPTTPTRTAPPQQINSSPAPAVSLDSRFAAVAGIGDINNEEEKEEQEEIIQEEKNEEIAVPSPVPTAIPTTSLIPSDSSSSSSDDSSDEEDDDDDSEGEEDDDEKTVVLSSPIPAAVPSSPIPTAIPLYFVEVEDQQQENQQLSTEIDGSLSALLSGASMNEEKSAVYPTISSLCSDQAPESKADEEEDGDCSICATSLCSDENFQHIKTKKLREEKAKQYKCKQCIQIYHLGCFEDWFKSLDKKYAAFKCPNCKRLYDIHFTEEDKDEKDDAGSVYDDEQAQREARKRGPSIPKKPTKQIIIYRVIQEYRFEVPVSMKKVKRKMIRGLEDNTLILDDDILVNPLVSPPKKEVEVIEQVIENPK